jgi:hypothetical protein
MSVIRTIFPTPSAGMAMLHHGCDCETIVVVCLVTSVTVVLSFAASASVSTQCTAGWYPIGCVFTRAFGGYVFRRGCLLFANLLYDDGVGVVVPYLLPLHVRPCEVKNVITQMDLNTPQLQRQLQGGWRSNAGEESYWANPLQVHNGAVHNGGSASVNVIRAIFQTPSAVVPRR